MKCSKNPKYFLNTKQRLPNLSVVHTPKHKRLFLNAKHTCAKSIGIIIRPKNPHSVISTLVLCTKKEEFLTDDAIILYLHTT